MKKTILALSISALVVGCSTDTIETNLNTEIQAEAVAGSAQDALLKPSSLDFTAPDFNAFEYEDIQAALDIAIVEHQAEIDSIVANPEAPTIDNTLMALELSGKASARASGIFYHLYSTMGNDTLYATAAYISPKFAELNANIYLNPGLFERIDALYQQRAELDLDTETLRLLEVTHDSFVRAGAELSAEDKATMRELNARNAEISTQYAEARSASRMASSVYFEDASELSGLSQANLDVLALNAKDAGKEGGYLVILTNTTRQAILAQIDNRESRQKIWEASANRMSSGESDVTEIIKEIVEIRAEKAKLLGFDTWADYQLDARMAKTTDAAYELLGSMVPAVVETVQTQASEMNEIIVAEGGDFSVEAWDWAYYAAKLKAQKFSISDEEVMPYFEFNRVLEDGAFFALTEQFGISFERRYDLPTYHEDVLVYNVVDHDGEVIALFYGDYFAREGKRGGAWMGSFVQQSEQQNQLPVIYNVMSIPKAPEGQNTYISYDNTTTIFHELGHGVHGLFSDVKYKSLAGTSVTRDAVEFPSTYQEDWAIDPKVLANYAINDEGEQIPAELLAKFREAASFSQGFDTLEYLSAALLDLEWHSIEAGTEIDSIADFETAALAKHGVDISYVPPRYKTTYFNHVFGSGYSAGYYAYLWSEILAADAFAYANENGGLTREMGDRQREFILSIGNTKDMQDAYIEYRGRAATTDALLKRRGLK